MNVNIKDEKGLYVVCGILIITWIILTVLKKMNINLMIQRNTIGNFTLIAIGLSLSRYFFKNLYYTLPFIISIFIIHELLWYKGHISVFKDESETTDNFYSWANVYCSTIKNKDLTVDKESEETAADLSEGLFDNDWSLTNTESYNRKFGTYFTYLKLEPGMKILDVGCGNGHWLQYCKKRGVDGMGITISSSQVELCKKNGLNVIQGDIQTGILKTIKGKFDAVSAIGPVEHFSSVSSDEDDCNKILQEYYHDVMNLIDINSKSRRYLNSYMTTNTSYSKYRTLEWYYHIYLICATFGYGFYNSDENMMKIYNTHHPTNSTQSTVVKKRDYTEDYRWNMVRTKDSIGYCNYKFESFEHIFRFIEDITTDVGWWARFLYAVSDSWFWQFGGTSKVPIPEITDTPIRGYIYVTEINKI